MGYSLYRRPCGGAHGRAGGAAAAELLLHLYYSQLTTRTTLSLLHGQLSVYYSQLTTRIVDFDLASKRRPRGGAHGGGGGASRIKMSEDFVNSWRQIPT
jgi:hypothetical protein